MKLFHSIANALFAVEEHGVQELTDFRINTCERCPNFREGSRQCSVCGCFMDVKSKLVTNKNYSPNRIEITHCPLGYWKDIHIANMYRSIDDKELLTALEFEETV